MEALLYKPSYSSTDSYGQRLLGFIGCNFINCAPLDFKYTSEFTIPIKEFNESELLNAVAVLSQSTLDKVWMNENDDEWAQY